ncbi:MAG TPA: hypothetical protein VF666_15085 [Pyrinomonadaceae bacterium]|jgi:hypothetical protein
MNTRTRNRLASQFIPVFFIIALHIISLSNVAAANVSVASVQNAAAKAGAAPSDVVREFYKAMREKRFREAFGMSIYRPAIEGLSAEEYEELRPDFENLARDIPEKIDINGEQISGETATVFMRVADAKSGEAQTEPVTLVRDGSAWIVGDRANQELVKKQGKQFFMEARIAAHHSEVQAELQQIAKAQFVYHSKNEGVYADLATLASEGLVAQETARGQALGYQFQLMLGKENRSYAVRAEPLRYGRTGRLSFFMDAGGIASKDTGGKPLKVSSVK